MAGLVATAMLLARASPAEQNAAVMDRAILGNAKLAAMGFVDVTAAPFSADPTGKMDSTRAIQDGIVFASNHQMILFFPAGEYLVSDTLVCDHARFEFPSHTKLRPRNRDWPCALVGSTRGPKRPKIVLAPHSKGFGDPSHPKPVVNMFAREPKNYDAIQDNVNMNQMLIGIDVTIGEGNPGAIGVRNRAAQGSSVQDCAIDATHGFAGLSGGAGSGGGHFNVTVIGGRFGAYLAEAQPAPTIAGFTLIGQTESAIYYDGRQSLSAVGCRIVMAGPGPAVLAGTPNRWFPTGQVCMVDSTIEFEKPGAGNAAFAANSNLYLNNVYVRGAHALVVGKDGSRVPIAYPKTWTRVREYAHGDRAEPFALGQGKTLVQFESPVYRDGKRQEADAADLAPNQQPPDGLVSRHALPKDLPSWESPGAVNVKEAPYNAKGDGRADDWAAIQKAVNEHDIVFLPKGSYAVSGTVRLRPSTRLIGAYRCFTWLKPFEAPGGDFADSKKPAPVVQTPNDAEAETILANCGIMAFYDVPASYCLLWQSGRKSIYLNVNVVIELRQPANASKSGAGSATTTDKPLVVISGVGGGRWYTFFQESWQRQGPNYRHLLVDGTTQPLAFYQCNPEHARSDANMEIRGAQNVSLYGVKGEYNQPILWIRDSDNVRVFGYGGNAAAWPGKALFVVERTPNFLLANLVDTPRGPESGSPASFAGQGTDPKKWSMVEERAGGEAPPIVTRPLDRPVLYMRGAPSDQPK